MKFFCVKKFVASLSLLMVSALMPTLSLAQNACDHSNNVNGKCSCGKFVMYYTTNSINLPEWQGFENTTVNGKLAWVFSSSTIGNGKLQAVDGLVSVVIPEGVTAIGDGAFARCKDLKSVVIPGSVKTIASGAFQQCAALEDLQLGYGIEKIAGGAFAQCSSLKTLNIPGSVKSIGFDGEFGNNPTTELVLGDGVQNIGNAFQGCTSLVSLVIPGSVAKIPNDAFSGCSNLRTVEFKDGVASIGDRAFKGCPISEVILPGSVNHIGAEAFDNYTNINVTVTDGKLPETNTKINLQLNDNSSLEALMDAADNEKVASVSYTRDMNAGAWGTICLPFDVESNVDVVFYQLEQADEVSDVMTFKAIEGVVNANTPCVIQKIGDSKSLELKASTFNVSKDVDLTIELANNWSIIGTYFATRVYVTEETPNLYYIKSNQFLHANGYFNLKPFRAYFKYDGAISSSSAASRFSIEISENETGLDSVAEAQEEGVLYDLAGNRVENMVNGQIYILNGKKVMFK